MRKPAHRKCQACLQAKPYEVFHTLNSGGALHPWCKDCQRSHMSDHQKNRTKGGRKKLRQCSQCELSFAPNCFHWLKSTGTYHSYCRGCHATYMGLRYHLVKPKARLSLKR